MINLYQGTIPTKVWIKKKPLVTEGLFKYYKACGLLFNFLWQISSRSNLITWRNYNRVFIQLLADF